MQRALEAVSKLSPGAWGKAKRALASGLSGASLRSSPRHPAFTLVFKHILLVQLIGLLLTGCGSSSGGDKKHQIAVIPKGTTHVFWKSVHAGAQKAARELGNVEIYWKGAYSEGDQVGQIQVVENCVVEQFKGIVLAPLDRTALVHVVREAKKQGIPTVIFDSALDDESSIVSYVATDNYRSGQLAARELGKRLGGKGNAILLRYAPGSESTEQREKGFLDAITKEFPDVKMLSDNQYAGTTQESALDKSLALLSQFGDQVQGIFTVCEPITVGMLKALEQEGLAGKVVFIGFDPSPHLIQAMSQGKIQGIVLQDPVNMGYQGVKTMVAHLEGKPVAKRIPTGETVATPENMNTPEIKRLLSPEQAD